jgi:hypothetical protein
MAARRRSRFDHYDWRWPLYLTVGMFVIAFVPYLSIVNLFLFVPVGLLLSVLLLKHKVRPSHLAWSFVLLLASGVISLVVTIAPLFQVTPG